MRPANLRTKIFLDSGDPDETKQTINLLGFLDGQTTNPTLISKNPKAKGRLDRGDKFTKEEIFGFYKEVVKEISGLIPNGSISIEVYADRNTTTEQMLERGREMFSWIPSAHIKFPTTSEGLKAAQKAINERMRVNMTLCFSQEQAAAVYAATKESKKETLTGFKNVFVSPFIGRLDDRGENGMDLIKNIIRMYNSAMQNQKGDHHVEVLTASVRSLNHFLYAIKLESDIITAPFKTLKEWAEKGMPMPDESFKYNASNLKSIPYQQIALNKPWQNYNISHDLTDVGIEKFSTDWNELLKPAL
jgi:transaldolase